eukprot:TRINITY_DN11896_c0_g1_i1.p4 TRINITY_DN11896_c0_g1~~TRINITY_DN11896_c0_g1_i1.p4  ORF type:complete len:111 (-),score=54.80 TRINITY_DN11896_c0_g1_i1:174-506(-)
MVLTIVANCPYAVYLLFMVIKGGDEIRKRGEFEFIFEFCFNAGIEMFMIIIIPFAISVQTKLQTIRYGSVQEHPKKSGYVLYMDGKKKYVAEDQEESQEEEKEMDTRNER